MKVFSLFLTLFTPTAFAECDWSYKYTISELENLTFQECNSPKKLKINSTVITPEIEFLIVHEHYPEGKTIWAKTSPNKKVAIVWIENTKYERELWVINLINSSVEFHLTSLSEGKHFSAKFVSDEKFKVTVAGMGYKNTRVYRLVSGQWQT
jgi:hypothetical protein